MTKKMLYSPKELAALIGRDDTVIIDIRDDNRYNDGHIPTAVNIPELFYYLAESTEEGREELQAVFEKLFSRAGLSQDKRAVIYEDDLDSRYGSSCRGVEILSYLGHEDAGLLDGGYRAWLNAGLPVETAANSGSEATFTASPRTDVFVTKEEMLAAIDDPSIVLLDNRDSDEWRGLSSSPYGKDFAPRKGRIPGAVWIEWYEFLERSRDIPAFRSSGEIVDICAKRGISPESDIIIYCFKGSRAANTYIALIKSGFEKVRIYFGSWNEWSRDFSLPVDDRVLEPEK